MVGLGGFVQSCGGKSGRRAAVQTLVLDDAPIEVSLAVLPSFDSSQEHDSGNSITKTNRWELGSDLVGLHYSPF